MFENIHIELTQCEKTDLYSKLIFNFYYKNAGIGFFSCTLIKPIAIKSRQLNLFAAYLNSINKQMYELYASTDSGTNLSFTKNVCLINEIYLIPEWRSKGAGHFILNKILTVINSLENANIEVYFLKPFFFKESDTLTYEDMKAIIKRNINFYFNVGFRIFDTSYNKIYSTFMRLGAGEIQFEKFGMPVDASLWTQTETVHYELPNVKEQVIATIDFVCSSISKNSIKDEIQDVISKNVWLSYDFKRDKLQNLLERIYEVETHLFSTRLFKENIYSEFEEMDEFSFHALLLAAYSHGFIRPFDILNLINNP